MFGVMTSARGPRDSLLTSYCNMPSRPGQRLGETACPAGAAAPILKVRRHPTRENAMPPTRSGRRGLFSRGSQNRALDNARFCEPRLNGVLAVGAAVVLGCALVGAADGPQALTAEQVKELRENYVKERAGADKEGLA